jgi:hypothetical protein
MSTKGSVNNAISAAKKTANAIAAKKAALSTLNKQREAAEKAEPKGTTIEQNALSMSGEKFKGSLRARGFAI